MKKETLVFVLAINRTGTEIYQIIRSEVGSVLATVNMCTSWYMLYEVTG